MMLTKILGYSKPDIEALIAALLKADGRKSYIEKDFLESIETLKLGGSDRFTNAILELDTNSKLIDARTPAATEKTILTYLAAGSRIRNLDIYVPILIRKYIPPIELIDRRIDRMCAVRITQEPLGDESPLTFIVEEKYGGRKSRLRILREEE